MYEASFHVGLVKKQPVPDQPVPIFQRYERSDN